MKKRMNGKLFRSQYNLKGNDAVQGEIGSPENKLDKQLRQASEILPFLKRYTFSKESPVKWCQAGHGLWNATEDRQSRHRVHSQPIPRLLFLQSTATNGYWEA